MKTKFTMIMAVIATFAISLNLHSSNEEVVFGAPAYRESTDSQTDTSSQDRSQRATSCIRQ